MFTLIRTCALLAAFALTASAASEENVNRQVDAVPGGKLVVDVDFGTIDVTAGADDKVAVEAHRKIDFSDEAKEKEYFSGAPIAINKEGNTVTVRAHSSKRESFWNFGRSRTEGHYTLRVPRNFAAALRTAGGGIATSELRGEVKAKTSGGKLKFEHVEGPVVGETSGGSIEVRACNGAIEIETSGGEIATEDSKGSLHARTSGGGIHVRNFSGDTEVKTSGGELTLDRIAGKLTGKTSGGSISASVVGSVMGDVTLETSAGSIDLVLPANAAVDIAAETSAGRITSNLPLLLGKPDHEHLHGKLNGGGKTVLLRTSAGSITIDAGSPETAAL